MKIRRIIRKPIVIIFSILFLSALFSLLLYRSFCTLNQIVDWDAVNGITNIILAFLTIVAVITAIEVPRDDRLFTAKMELFNQRFEVYIFYRQYINDLHTRILTITQQEFDVMVLRSGCLLDPDDIHKIAVFILTLKNKFDVQMENNISSDEPLFSLNEAQEDLFHMFEKYLNLTNYGLEDSA